MAFDASKFYVGVNMGWMATAYGWDLGKSFSFTSSDSTAYGPVLPVAAEFRSQLRAHFHFLQLNGIKVVRMWLLEKLDGLFINRSRPTSGQTFQINTSSDQWRLINSADFAARLAIIMEEAAEAELLIYWTLFDAALLLNNNNPPSWYRVFFNYLLGDANGRTQLKTHVIQPFLTAINAHASSVMAIDIVNEVNWAWRNGTNTRSLSGQRAIMLGGVTDYFNFIKANSSYSCTASFSNYTYLTQNNQVYNAIGDSDLQADVGFLDFYDLHRYHDPATPTHKHHGLMPQWNATKPCFIGEVGHHYHPIPSPRNPDRQAQAATTSAMLADALAKGYFGALPWRHTAFGNEHRMLEFTAPTGSSLTTAYNTFLQTFQAAATQSRTSGGSLASFAAFEPLVWSTIRTFNTTIPATRVPS